MGLTEVSFFQLRRMIVGVPTAPYFCPAKSKQKLSMRDAFIIPDKLLQLDDDHPWSSIPVQLPASRSITLGVISPYLAFRDSESHFTPPSSADARHLLNRMCECREKQEA
ncbi:hypothetical protein [Dongshaea marina]|uniref:hypothetical protein n=1 Tax=Dongshaea marina TaxID=2047966 RepID=UPI000D3E57CE|nr:hypothetical protein [Dongshaea marina]